MKNFTVFTVILGLIFIYGQNIALAERGQDTDSKKTSSISSVVDDMRKKEKSKSENHTGISGLSDAVKDKVASSQNPDKKDSSKKAYNDLKDKNKDMIDQIEDMNTTKSDNPRHVKKSDSKKSDRMKKNDTCLSCTR